MTKESTIESQKVDCNCNDCKYMERDFKAFSDSMELHQTWQFSAFEIKKLKLKEKAEEWASNGDYEKATALFNEAEGLKFMFDKSGSKINYGNCQRFDKPVSFIPNTCQIETQNCFEHRRA